MSGKWDEAKAVFAQRLNEPCDILPAKCQGCGWDSAKRYENRLMSEYDGYIPAVSVRARLGERPEHSCGKPTLAKLLNTMLPGAINNFRVAVRIDKRTPNRGELKRLLAMTLDELEMTE